MDATLILLSCIIIFSILAIELKDLVKAAISLGVVASLLSAVFYLRDAPYAAMFELIICAGLITVLFVIAINLTKGVESET